MHETMRAVVSHGPKDYRLEQLPVPTPGPREALVRVEAVGICASDLKCYHGARSSGVTTLGRRGPKRRSCRVTSSSAGW